MPSVGLRNKNYLNVKNGTDPWMDAGGKRSKTDAKGHAVFSDPTHGIRAGMLLLRAYFLKHRLRTVLAILSRWAPPDDTIGSVAGNPHNDPTEYAVFVARRMGVRYDRPLELFRPDGSIDNIGQLRALFTAMAAYEIGGGFEVAAAELDAGLELVEPGITKNGTADVVGHAAGTTAWRLGGSVGRVDKGATNAAADVETVQSLLRTAAMILDDPRIDPGSIDGTIDPKAARSDTVRAIVAFQRRFLTKPDGVIEVDGRTWRELVAVVGGAGPSTASTNQCFPLATVPSSDWTSGACAFAANRAGNRAHAACDLYAPEGTIIHAMADGTVVRGPYPFYAQTYALEVDHGAFLARYGEIQASTFVQAGDRVTCGQPIARVGHLVGISVESDMLHLELYEKTAHGPLSTAANESAVAANGRRFMRRRDLQDPAPLLARLKDHLPAPSVMPADTNGASPLAMPSEGFCIRVRRLRQEEREEMGYSRTVAEYRCYWDGAPIHDLDGQMIERGGPGDNSGVGVAEHRRIAEGTYPLAIHGGTKYKTYGYAAGGSPLPGLALLDTGERSYILIHPAHHQHGYVSSIGCLNPAVGLTNAASKIHLTDSRNRAIAIIEGLKAKLGREFPRGGPIPGAVVVIEGEPS